MLFKYFQLPFIIEELNHSQLLDQINFEFWYNSWVTGFSFLMLGNYVVSIFGCW